MPLSSDFFEGSYDRWRPAFFPFWPTFEPVEPNHFVVGKDTSEGERLGRHLAVDEKSVGGLGEHG